MKTSRLLAGLAALAFLLPPPPTWAAFHVSMIDEVMSGVGANPNLQYVEIRMLAGAQNFVAKARLTAFGCAAGNPATVLLLLPANVPSGTAGGRWIMASPDAATFLAAAGISPDFPFAPGIPPDCGMLCWGAPVGPGFLPPADPASWNPSDPSNYVDCVAYGGYGGPKPTFATTTSGSPGNGTLSLTRTGSGFGLACPSPTNDAGMAGSFAACTPPTTTATTSTTSTTLVSSAGGGCPDAAAVSSVRAQVEAQCPCDAAASHGKYVKCAAAVAKMAVKAGTLPKACKGAVKKCAAHSSCGKPGAVTCCRTNAKGVQTCSIKRSSAACKAPKHGSACVGDQPSCCDACGGATCPAVTRTTAPTTTTLRRTTTTMPHATTTTLSMCTPNGRSCATNPECCSRYCYVGRCY